MKYERLTVGYLSTNCYIVYDEVKKEGIVIDPGENSSDIIEKIKELGIKLKYIVFTHVHFDHILAYHDVKNEFPESVLLLSYKEEDALFDNNRSLLSMVNIDFPEIRGYETVKQDELITFGDVSLRVLETPGHTAGSICLYGEDTLFSGDTLFCGSIGRYDFPGGSYTEEINSIKNILLNLPGKTVVYPGHGDKTTIEFESKNNGFLI